jgi:hypothetical protein
VILITTKTGLKGNLQKKEIQWWLQSNKLQVLNFHVFDLSFKKSFV